MRATTIHGPGDIRFEEVPDPTIEQPTDAIVRVVRGCICGSDLWPYRGIDGSVPGSTIGHECIGEIVEVGSGVRDFKPGDFVIVPFDHCDNTCPHCRAGMQSGCVNLGFTVSGQGEYARVNFADGSLVSTHGTPDESMLPALLTLSDVMATGWHAAVSAGVQPGSTVAVVGDGAVGLCGVLAARQLGAERIIAMSRHASRTAVAEQFGATDTVAERGKDAVERVRGLTDGVGADAVLECVGAAEAMQTAIKIARAGARVGYVGVPHDIDSPLDLTFRRNIGLVGGMAPVRKYLPDLVELVLAGTIDPSPVFDVTLPMSESAAGYRAMDERRAIKVLLEP
ncbi:MAG TPA: zinc-dependent alcohol dehydrogenase family protein [Aeromicrobium sp.]|nr:zinc-dependent alcohol dehydrogenase family protein [Aeromicrobium sp.]HKY58603.1 zinc-dependent alcohol dehydrogenase family protein [Aeromicrobium sp.]